MNEKYYYAGNCTETWNGNRIQEITGYDQDEETLHPKEFKIPKRKFKEMTGGSVDADKFDYFGFNEAKGVVFGYNWDEDIHYFYTISGTIDLE